MRGSNKEIILDLKAVFDVAHSFSTFFCELPTTQYYVVGVGYIHISDMFQKSKIVTIDSLKLKCSRYRMQCVVSNTFLTAKQSIGFTLHRFLSDKGRPQASAAAPDLYPYIFICSLHCV